jgi:hypothetical protein
MAVPPSGAAFLLARTAAGQRALRRGIPLIPVKPQADGSGGILFATLITLALVPALFMVVDDLARWAGDLRAAGKIAAGDVVANSGGSLAAS